jgi:epoxyqueuosine reductase
MTQGLNQALERFAVAESLSQLKWKVCVDTSAVLERAWAELTGLGWIGKNTLLIHPRLGSYVFIGVAFLNRSFHRGPRTQKNLCGNCARCLQGCPTRAFPEPGVLDARACISYLTLEKRGEFNENENQLVASTGFVAGCDICQEVCPFNYKPAKAAESPQKTDPSLAQRLPSDWDKLLEETEQAYRERTRGTALARIKPTDFQRNVRVVYSANRKP